MLSLKRVKYPAQVDIVKIKLTSPRKKQESLESLEKTRNKNHIKQKKINKKIKTIDLLQPKQILFEL